MSVTPLTYQDTSRIIDAFDRDKFKTLPLKSLPYARQMIAINQLERSFDETLPVEIIDQIVRSYIESSPSIRTLLMYYIGSPSVTSKYSYPLASDKLLNGASKILLLKLGKKPSAERGDLVYFKQLMTCVFEHHFHRLNRLQKLELLQNCYIAPWEQRSPEEKLVLLGRAQHLSGWRHPTIKLQFLSWKIRFAVARILNSDMLGLIILAPLAVFALMLFTGLVLALFYWINNITFKNKNIEDFIDFTFKKLANGIYKFVISSLITTAGGCATSLFFAGLGTTLKIRYLPTRIQEKGAWIQLFSLNCFQISWNCFQILITILGSSNSKDRNRDRRDQAECEANIAQAFDGIKKQLTEAIKEANIGIEQETFIEAQLPDLLEKWHQQVSQTYRLT